MQKLYLSGWDWAVYANAHSKNPVATSVGKSSFGRRQFKRQKPKGREQYVGILHIFMLPSSKELKVV